MYEHYKQPVIPFRAFLKRLLRHIGVAAAIILFSLGIGILGYRLFGGLSWVDSLLNASMILGGMGPVNLLSGNGAKIFASFYALYSGLVLLVTVGVLLAPVVHRLLHHFHTDSENKS
jgi:hypothetical protein